MQTVYECMEKTCQKLRQLNVDISNIKAVGVTNQRETTLVWDKETGEPLFNAIVWLDLRTQSTVERLIRKTPGRSKNHLKHKTGLPISTYFSAVKLRWLLDNVDDVNKAVLSKRAMFGTVDSWIIWCLTGGRDGGVHITDVSNASRTMLFNIHTMDWDPELCSFFDVPMEILPKVRSSSEIYGQMRGQQTQQRHPDVPLPRHLLQLLWEEPKAFPGQPRDIVPFSTGSIWPHSTPLGSLCERFHYSFFYTTTYYFGPCS
ncbi:hypothetical protein AMECASPLE_032907 [Ameca splendens]|uniref:glycerol kinase n=1 Tax=Ameca splendens TaxID=208324 RepID=A0ABV0XVL1_9TELE